METADLTRRHFLRRLGLATGAVVGTSLLDDLRVIAQPAKPVHVVILGAGLAGLCAAYELERRGHTAVVLEAETRHVGGRARTLCFGDGLYGEAGAMRIPQSHELTRHYVKDMGLTLRRFVHSTPHAYVYSARSPRTNPPTKSSGDPRKPLSHTRAVRHRLLHRIHHAGPILARLILERLSAEREERQG